jgi:hypothetical protein
VQLIATKLEHVFEVENIHRLARKYPATAANLTHL